MSIESVDLFVKALSEALDIEADVLSTAVLPELDEFDSIARILTSELIYEMFDFEIDLEDLSEMLNIAELWDFVLSNRPESGD